MLRCLYLENDAPMLTGDSWEHPPRWKCLFTWPVVVGSLSCTGTCADSQEYNTGYTKLGKTWVFAFVKLIVWEKQAGKGP